VRTRKLYDASRTCNGLTDSSLVCRDARRSSRIARRVRFARRRQDIAHCSRIARRLNCILNCFKSPRGLTPWASTSPSGPPGCVVWATGVRWHSGAGEGPAVFPFRCWTSGDVPFAHRGQPGSNKRREPARCEVLRRSGRCSLHRRQRGGPLGGSDAIGVNPRGLRKRFKLLLGRRGMRPGHGASCTRATNARRVLEGPRLRDAPRPKPAAGAADPSRTRSRSRSPPRSTRAARRRAV
jgi:hypothetical protein